MGEDEALRPPGCLGVPSVFSQCLSVPGPLFLPPRKQCPYGQQGPYHQSRVVPKGTSLSIWHYAFFLNRNAPTRANIISLTPASPTGVDSAATVPRIDVSGPKVYGLPYRRSTRGRKPADKQRTSEERAVRIAYKRESKSLRYAFSSL